jgi:hypothetical protein
MAFLDGDKNRDTDILESLLCNKVMKRLRGNVHMLHYGISWTERLTKQSIREEKVESDFEEREQYEANLQQEILVVLEWYETPVANL